MSKSTSKTQSKNISKKQSKYINRELSWLEFNQRVLDEARDPSLPLLERLKFLAISGSNLDEFFRVRVGGLQVVAGQLLAEPGRAQTDPSGMTPEEQLSAISARTHSMSTDQIVCHLDELEPALASAGVMRIRSADLTEAQADSVERIFEEEIFATLTPMIVTSADDFPLLVTGTLSVCVHVRSGEVEEEARFALIPFGRSTPRFVTVPSDGGYEYMLLEDVVSRFIGRFFPGEDVVECVPIRITRNADLSVSDDQAADLLVQMSEVLDARRQGHCVRLEISDHVTSKLFAFLKSVLRVADRDIYASPGPLGVSSFMQLTELPGLDRYRFDAWPPQRSPAVEPSQNIFDCIADHDILLFHPYETFEPVVRFLEEAAVDPDVLAIKQILYRTSPDSSIVAALARAAQNGKSVTAVVELKARFDEARNIEWAKSLEQAEVQVIYGIKGLKTHAKVCIVVRREPHGVQRYVHFGTGNYNEQTSRIYSDASLMTSNEELTADAIGFFNAICGYSQPPRYQKIEAAPIGMRDKLLEMIASEIEYKRQGRKTRITCKLNSLGDPAIIDALYEASAAGVRVKLNVRGICCLRPGMKKVGENISVVSVVDRFLEHSRVLHFLHGGDDRVFISSADWMPRNLDRRIELLVPVEDPICRNRLIKILKSYFRDNTKSHALREDGTYERLEPGDGEKLFRSQQYLYEMAREELKLAEESQTTVFQPHRAPGRAS